MAVYKITYLLSLLLLHHDRKKDVPYLEKQVVQLTDSEAITLQETNTTQQLQAWATIQQLLQVQTVYWFQHL